MPAEHGVRLDDEERVAPFGKPSTDENPEPAVAVAQPRARRPALQHKQLLAQAEILRDQDRSGCEPRRNRLPRPPDHARLPPVLPLTEGFHRPGEKESGVDRVLAPYSPLRPSPSRWFRSTMRGLASWRTPSRGSRRPRFGSFRTTPPTASSSPGIRWRSRCWSTSSSEWRRRQARMAREDAPCDAQRNTPDGASILGGARQRFPARALDWLSRQA
jgi:hypothetical protein